MSNKLYYQCLNCHEPCFVDRNPLRTLIDTPVTYAPPGPRVSSFSETKLTWAQKKKEQLRERDGDDCCLCGQKMNFTIINQDNPEFVTIEHIVRKTDGGTDDNSNLALAHKECNNIKGGVDAAADFQKGAISLKRRQRLQRWANDPLHPRSVLARAMLIALERQEQDRNDDEKSAL